MIDDGSSDGTAEQVRKFQRLNPHEQIEFVSKENSGLVSSLILGLSKVGTDYVYIVASDDVPNPYGVVKCIRELEEKPSLQFCMGGGHNFFDGGTETPIYGREHELFFGMDEKRRGRDVFLDYPSPLLLQATVFRTSALSEIGGWDTRIAWDDYPTFVKLLSKFPVEGRDFLFRPEFLVVKYRHHGNNSYRDICRQFSMVRQSLELLAPVALLDRAIGYALGRYVLTALRTLEIGSLVKIVADSSWMVRLYALRGFYRAVVRKARKILV